MISAQEIVEEIIKVSPFLEQGLSKGVINLSSLARIIKPQVSKLLLKEIKEGAIIMALKRLSDKLEKKNSKLLEVLQNLGDITVRSNIVEFTFNNSPTLTEKIPDLIHSKNKLQNAFLTFTEGVFETSIFASVSLEKDIENILKGESIKNKQKNLSSITILIPEEATFVPGVYYSILKVLAWEGINFVEVISSFTELTIFLEKDNVDKAFSTLKNTFNQ